MTLRAPHLAWAAVITALLCGVAYHGGRMLALRRNLADLRTERVVPTPQRWNVHETTCLDQRDIDRIYAADKLLHTEGPLAFPVCRAPEQHFTVVMAKPIKAGWPCSEMDWAANPKAVCVEAGWLVLDGTRRRGRHELDVQRSAVHVRRRCDQVEENAMSDMSDPFAAGRWQPSVPQIRCPACGSERNATEPRCLNQACTEHQVDAIRWRRTR